MEGDEEGAESGERGKRVSGERGLEESYGGWAAIGRCMAGRFGGRLMGTKRGMAEGSGFGTDGRMGEG